MNLRDAIPAVKASITIAQVVNLSGKYVVSSNVPTQICCFSHSEIRPSMRVYPSTNLAYCWTCGKAFDVIASYQKLFGVEDLKDAVAQLCEKFNVTPESSPVLIEKFYQLAHEYQAGNPKSVKETLKKVGDDFRAYYEKVIGFKHIQDRIDWLWSEYDQIYAAGGHPAEIYRKAVEWYSTAIALINSDKQMCKEMEMFSVMPELWTTHFDMSDLKP